MWRNSGVRKGRSEPTMDREPARTGSSATGAIRPCKLSAMRMAATVLSRIPGVFVPQNSACGASGVAPIARPAARRRSATSRRGSAGDGPHERAQRLRGGWTAGIRCSCGCCRTGALPIVPACRPVCGWRSRLSSDPRVIADMRCRRETKDASERRGGVGCMATASGAGAAETAPRTGAARRAGRLRGCRVASGAGCVRRSARVYTGRIGAGDLGRLRRQVRSGLNGLWPRTNPDVASWSHTVGVGSAREGGGGGGPPAGTGNPHRREPYLEGNHQETPR